MKRLSTLALLVTVFVSPLIASPAKACSCGLPSDIAAWVDESEAAFVGTMIEKRDSGSGQFGDESIYVFEVEQWVKGGAGDVIEVRSASNGAACGFEFWNDDNRTGAILHEENGELHGSLCTQVDADVLLAAMTGPTPSTTGIPAMLVAKGWNSTGLDVLDASGGFISTVGPPGDPEDFVGTQSLKACPGAELAIQQTSNGVYLWDLTTLEVTRTHIWSEDLNEKWIESAACMDPSGDSIYVVVGTGFSRQLIDLVSGEEKAELNGWVISFGKDHVVLQSESDNGDLLLVELSTGDQRPLVELPPDENRGVYADLAPSGSRLAVLEVFYTGNGRAPDSTLSILDLSGGVETAFEISGESQGPRWIDEDRIYLQSLDWDSAVPASGLVVDITTGETIKLKGFSAYEVTTNGRIAVGANGGEILEADLETAAVKTLVVLPTQQAGPIVFLPADANVEPTGGENAPSPRPTTPPLVLEPSITEAQSSNTRLVAGITVGIAVLGIVWLAFTTMRPRKAPSSDESDG